MNINYYKKLIDQYLIEDAKKGTDKLLSVSNLWQTDSEIKPEDQQELLLYIGLKCVNTINTKIDDMIKNPLEKTENIDKVIEKLDDRQYVENPWKDKFKLN